jgi:3-hydroxybutyryl-CoA dehydrogenase
MGAGIAHALLLAGARVVLCDADSSHVDAGVSRVRDMVATSAARGTLDGSVDAVMARLRGGVGLADLAGHVIVEAVPEQPALKAGILAGIEAAVAPDVLVATNTSSISIDHLAHALTHPERFVGLHFFNPVPASKLVEVVVGTRSSPQTVARAQAIVEAIGKTAIVVHDSPGFASSRLGVLLGLEAIRMFEEGVASAEHIDLAMTLGYKHPMGPLKLTDVVGLDVRLGVAEYLASALGPRFEPPALLREMVSRGELGQKSGRGFYTWNE